MKTITKNWQDLKTAEQVEELAKVFNLKFKEDELKEIADKNLFELLTDDQTQDGLKNKRLKKMLSSIRDVAEIFSYAKIKTKGKIESPRDVAGFLQTILKKTTEGVVAVYLAPNGDIIDYENISDGTTTQTAVYPQKIAKSAILKNAKAVIVAHNHPEDKPTPSKQDIVCTKALEMGLSFVEIKLLDHIIVGTGDNYFSFSNNDII